MFHDLLSKFVLAYIFKSFNPTVNVQDSNVYIYDKIWAAMNNKEGMFVQSAKDGIERVSKEDGKYAFFAESPLVDYVVERHCDLKQVGGLLDAKSYGIGLPKSKELYINCTPFN